MRVRSLVACVFISIAQTCTTFLSVVFFIELNFFVRHFLFYLSRYFYHSCDPHANLRSFKSSKKRPRYICSLLWRIAHALYYIPCLQVRTRGRLRQGTTLRIHASIHSIWKTSMKPKPQKKNQYVFKSNADVLNKRFLDMFLSKRRDLGNSSVPQHVCF